jgi:hypothetical protein
MGSCLTAKPVKVEVYPRFDTPLHQDKTAIQSRQRSYTPVRLPQIYGMYSVKSMSIEPFNVSHCPNFIFRVPFLVPDQK